MKNPLPRPPLSAPDAGLAPDVASLVAAARRRGIPCIRHPEGAGLVQLGWGRRARRIQGAVTWNRSHIAVQIARDPTLAKSLLRDAGVPVPAGAEARGACEAVEIFHRLGAPVVVRALAPGIADEAATDLASDDAVRAAYERARRRGAGVVVERELAGADHRALVVDGRLVAVARLAAPSITGDGFRTVAGLLDAENRARRDTGRMAVPADQAAQEMLARQGLALESIPPAGMCVKLRAAPDLGAGATAEDVTAAVHPAVAEACERAARAIGLDVAGVRLVCGSVSSPLEAQGGGVVGITAAPDICMHERAGASGVSDSVLGTLFGGGNDGRIPLVAVAGGSDAAARLIARAFHASGLRTGLADGEGTAPASAFAVLGCADIEAAVLQLSGETLMAPLAFDRCDVAVLTAPGACAMPGAVELAASARSLVLDAAEPRSAVRARMLAGGASIVYVSVHGPAGVAASGSGAGRAWVYLRGHTVLAATPERQIPLAEMRRIPSALRIEDALAAIAALWSCGVEERAIAAALAPRPPRAADDPDVRGAGVERVRSRAAHAQR
jgi:cyanophycin synthetase